ncbi:MAG: hypothetical protein DMG10_19170 [Acidobacteria bacterium]|nr:MAG: hypothetical protein DMG10_19170 [Acidobacteriota bacterium]
MQDPFEDPLSLGSPFQSHVCRRKTQLNGGVFRGKQGPEISGCLFVPIRFEERRCQQLSRLTAHRVMAQIGVEVIHRGRWFSGLVAGEAHVEVNLKQRRAEPQRAPVKANGFVVFLLLRQNYAEIAEGLWRSRRMPQVLAVCRLRGCPVSRQLEGPCFFKQRLRIRSGQSARQEQRKCDESKSQA